MKRKLTLLTLMLTFTIGLWAQEATPKLVVWKTNGSTVLYALSEEPVTTFANNKLVITTSSTTVEYPLAEVQRYTYEGVETGIESFDSDNSVLIKQEKDKLSLVHLQAGAEVRLYNSSGNLLQIVKSNGTDPVVISLSTRPQGVYIVKSGNETIKLMKR